MAVDRDSPTWRAMKAHCEHEIVKGRDQLETVSHGCEFTRGRIAALRGILALAEAKPEIDESPRFY